MTSPWKCVRCGCGLFAAVVAVVYYYLLGTSENGFFHRKTEHHGVYTVERINLWEVFNKLDCDGDGQLSFSEFVNVQNYFETIVDSPDSEVFKVYSIQDVPDVSVISQNQLVTLKATFVPLLLNSLTKDIQSIPNDQLGALQGLLEWKVPFNEQQAFPISSFSVFLPPHHVPLLPGSTWWIISPIFDETQSPVSSFKHLPPKMESKFYPLFSLLLMLHPQPFLWTRYAPQGTVAVLRAIGSNYFDIMFRMHAEFQLNKPPLLPFWFTPSQFQGRLIISQDGSKILHFHLDVPNTKKLNVDMEWLNGPSENNMEVDIGYLPQMSISTLHDRSGNIYNKDILDHEKHLDSLSWLEKITTDEAFSLLESTMYAFKEVKYYNITEAFDEAISKSKLIHGILLWGALDDQSC